MASCEKILIVGFSGAGKTALLTALKPLAPDHWDYFDDLDQMIMRRFGKKHTHLAYLIDEVGWQQFRLWERQFLEGWLKDEGKGVLALGSGTLSSLLWELFGKQRKIRFCYLEVPFETAWERLLSLTPSEVHPLVGLGKIRLEAQFNERLQVFEQIAWKLDGTKNLSQLARDFWQNAEV